MLATFWAFDESAPTPLAPSLPPWLASLYRTRVDEFAGRLDAARSELAAVARDALPPPWRLVADLLGLQITIREARHAALLDCRGRLRSFLASLPLDENATRARALLALGSLCNRLSELEAAERAFDEALALPESEPITSFLLDGLLQVFIGQGAWEESRRLGRLLLERRRDRDERVGFAITSGHLALMELGHGRHAEASALARDGLAVAGHALDAMTFSRLRLRCFLLEAALAKAEARAARGGATARPPRGLGPLHTALTRDLDATGAETHYLKGYAAVALARSSALLGRPEETTRWLRVARRHGSLPGVKLLIEHWTLMLRPRAPLSHAAWRRHMRPLVARERVCTEAEVACWLAEAERVEALGEVEAALRLVREVFDRATAANHPRWLARVESAWRRLDRASLEQRVVQRLAGAPLAELMVTRREDVSVVFSDLVGFTERSTRLPVDEVMSTVRSLFELAVPMLNRHRARPMHYAGDGMLAVLQGANHRRRAVDFALALAGRAALVTRVRRVVEGPDAPGLELRVGVASGLVVMGPIGNLVKTEFAAIGYVTNLAARLQGEANCGEVVCAAETVEGLGLDESIKFVEGLKGINQPVGVVRLRPR